MSEHPRSRAAGRPATGHRSPAAPAVLAVASSTGGPAALEVLLTALPHDVAAPVVVVQHMPARFTRMLADRLDERLGLSVVEAEAGMPLEPGCVYVAPGDFHMVVSGPAVRARIGITRGVPENSCRPAADVLFRSVARVYRERALAVVLTGMGSDGLDGARAIAGAGGTVLAQDRASSVVWGMPGAVALAGLATDVLPLDRLGPSVAERIGRRRSIRPLRGTTAAGGA
jgi:two-component system chemotaxis response regulator CheB